MDSKVKSQISDKVYEATLDDLYEADQGLEVDLYKLNVFNKDIMIAPGKVMSDTKKDVHYCYVYVIKDGRVAAKLGIYETHAKKGEVYDLTDFEGREFLLFDHYYNEPGTLVQYEMREVQETDNIFDYLKRFLKPVTNATAAIKEQRDMIRKITKRLEGKPEGMTLKLFKKQKPYDEDWLDSFKEERDNWMFILIVLEIVFNVKFIFEDSDGSEDEMRELVRSPANAREPSTVIRVSLEDTPRHIPEQKSQSKTKLTKSKALVVEESDSEEELKPVDDFPSPSEPDNEDTPLVNLVKKEDTKPTFKTTKSFSSKAPESKPVKSFSSKAPESKAPESKAPESKATESKPVKSFSSKAPESKAPESKPVKSFSSKAPESKASESKKSSLVEDLPPPPRAVSPSVKKTIEPRAVSPPKPRAVSPSVKKSSLVEDSPPKPRAVSPSVKKSSEPSKPKIVRSAPPPKLKTIHTENNA